MFMYWYGKECKVSNQWSPRVLVKVPQQKRLQASNPCRAPRHQPGYYGPGFKKK